ncbi:MAG: hypothetical protein KF805_02995 [Phycisphaeraceae bacterium]|nr:hypothetical protein [Phycisphaeraceae bacterium]
MKKIWPIIVCRIRYLLHVIPIVALALGSQVQGAPETTVVPLKTGSGSIKELFESGNAKFRAGLELAKSDREAADAKFGEAAGAWREVARMGGIRNAKLETNIANASLLAGDVPGAILAYRRALQINPTDSAIQSGLAAARRSAGTEALALGNSAKAKEEAGRSGGLRGTIDALGAVLQRASQWATNAVATRTLLVAGVMFYAAFFIGASLRILGWLRFSGYALAALAVCTVLAFGPLAVREIQAGRRTEAVVLASNVIARNGPAELYDPAFQEPLRPGLEVEITQRRGSWAQIRLRDGRSAWVRSDSLENI